MTRYKLFVGDNMLKKIVFILLILFFSSLTYVNAKPVCKVKNEEKIYRLDLTVPATFCKNQKNVDPSCKQFPKISLIQLHGLWPNYKKEGYPSGKCTEVNECPTQDDKKGKYCKYPNPPGLYLSSTWKQLGGFMAGREKCLERHEWVKHGTCSPMSAIEYYDWSLKKTKYIVENLQIPADRSVSRKYINEKISENLPELDGAFRLKCSKEFVRNVYVLYEWGDEPGNAIKTKSGKNNFGNCGNIMVFPSSP